MKLNLPLSSDDGEVDFTSYTIILYDDDTAYYINDTIHHLSYNTNHSFNITVVNCFGEQNSTLLSISEGIYECRINIIIKWHSFPQLVILQSIQLMVQSGIMS